MFVFIYYRWENFCHWQFKWQAANLVSICFLRRYLGLYWIRAECLRWVVPTPRCTGGEVGKDPLRIQDGKSGVIFVSNVFPSTYGPGFFGLYTESRSGDLWPPPAPETDMILAASLWVQLDPGSPSSSGVSGREQQINPMCQSGHDTTLSGAVTSRRPQRHTFRVESLSMQIVADPLCKAPRRVTNNVPLLTLFPSSSFPESCPPL